jgi:hypothetical protein
MAQVPLIFSMNLPAPTDGTTFPGWDTSSPPNYVKHFIPVQTDVWANAVINDIIFTGAADGLGENPPGTQGPAKLSFDAVYNSTSSEPWEHYVATMTFESNGTFGVANPWPTVIINNADFITPDTESNAARQEFTAPDGRLVAIDRVIDGVIVVQVTMLNNTEDVPGLTIYVDVTEAEPLPLGEIASLTFPPTSELPAWSSWTDIGGGMYSMPADTFDVSGLVHGDPHPMISLPAGLENDGLTNFSVVVTSDGTMVTYVYQIGHVFNPGMSSRRRALVPDWAIDETFDEFRIYSSPEDVNWEVQFDPLNADTTVTLIVPWTQPGLNVSMQGEGGTGGALLVPMEPQQVLLVKFPVPPPIEEWQTQSWSGVGTVVVDYKTFGTTMDGTADSNENGGVFEQYWTRVLPSFAERISAEGWYWDGNPTTPKRYNRTFTTRLSETQAPGPFFFTINGALIVPEYDPAAPATGNLQPGQFRGFFAISEPGMEAETLVEVDLLGVTYDPGSGINVHSVDVIVNIYSDVLPEGETLVKVFLGTPGQYFWTDFRGSRELV